MSSDCLSVSCVYCPINNAVVVVCVRLLGTTKTVQLIQGKYITEQLFALLGRLE